MGLLMHLWPFSREILHFESNRKIIVMAGRKSPCHTEKMIDELSGSSGLVSKED